MKSVAARRESHGHRAVEMGEIPWASLARKVPEDLRALGDAPEKHTTVRRDVVEDEVSRQRRHAPLPATRDDGEKLGGPARDGVEPDLVRRSAPRNLEGSLMEIADPAARLDHVEIPRGVTNATRSPDGEIEMRGEGWLFS